MDIDINTAVQFILDCDDENLEDLLNYLDIIVEDISDPDKDLIKIEVHHENNMFNFTYESYDKKLAIQGSLISCLMKDPYLSNKIINYAMDNY